MPTLRHTMKASAPAYSQRTVFGPFHRRLAPDVQDAATAVKQVLSGEIWGKRARFGLSPAVKAYVGPLPSGVSGIEFWSFEAPDRPHGPRGHWSIPGPHVKVDPEIEIVKLSVVFARVTQDLAA